jgi:hypothetical protein
MESWGIWKLIKVGFWLGIGFILPQLVVLYSGTALTVLAMPSIMEASVGSTTDDLVSGMSDRCSGCYFRTALVHHKTGSDVEFKKQWVT